MKTLTDRLIERGREFERLLNDIEKELDPLKAMTMEERAAVVTTVLTTLCSESTLKFIADAAPSIARESMNPLAQQLCDFIVNGLSEKHPPASCNRPN